MDIENVNFKCFVKNLLELKDKVKCSICLDVFKNPLKLSCKHTFCEGCLKEYIEKSEEATKATCPICRQKLKKDQLEKVINLTHLCDFIKNCSEDICDVLNLPSISAIDFKNLTITTDGNIFYLPSTDITTRLLPSLTQPAVSTHHSRKPFTDSQLKMNIQNWLNDNKNTFDRITSTQQTQTPSNSQKSFDMPSVSQFVPKFQLPGLTLRKKRRYKSLDVHVQKLSRRERRMSAPGRSSDSSQTDVVVIEQVDSEELVDEELESRAKRVALLKVLEEQCLEDMEVDRVEVKGHEKDSRWKVLKNESRVVLGKSKAKSLDVRKKKIGDSETRSETPAKKKKERKAKKAKEKYCSPANEADEGITSNNNSNNNNKALENPINHNNSSVPENNINNSEMDTKNADAVNDMDDEQIYLMSTQINKDLLPEKSTKILNDLLLVIKEYNKSFEGNHIENFKQIYDLIEKTKQLINKIKNNEENVNEKNTVDAFVQTTDFSDVVNKYVQTLAINADKSIQTESNDCTKIASKNSTLFNRKSDPSVGSLLVEKYANIFSSSLDNINYDTQDLLNKNPLEAQLQSKDNQTLYQSQTLHSIGRKQANKTTTQDKKRFKRIRTPNSSPSDSETEKPKKLHKFMRDDLDMLILSEEEAVKNQLSYQFSDDDDENQDYNGLMERVLAKYEQENQQKSGNVAENAVNKDSIVRKNLFSQQISLKTQNHLSPAVLEEFKNDFLPGSLIKNSLNEPNDDDIFYDENVMGVIDNDIAKNNEKSHKINTLSESLFGYSEDISKQQNTFKKPPLQNNKINIIEQVVISAKKKVNGEEEQDLFSDVDIIEATPPKKQPDVLLLSSQLPAQTLDFGESFLPPPPGFEDNDDRKESSATPDKLPNNSVFQTPNKPPQNKPTLATSTPRSSQIETIKLSNPISPIGLKQQTTNSPLTIIEQPSNCKTFMITPKQQKSILSYMRSSQKSKIESKPCVTCSRLDTKQMMAVSSLANKKMITYTNTFGSDVTHVVVNVNEKNCVKDHTIKFVSGVAAGVWILSFRWVEDCLRENRIVPEEGYEVLDVSGLAGPKMSRLMRKKDPLLKGFRVYAAPPFASATRADVENIVAMLGGKVVSKLDDLLQENGDVRIIITETTTTDQFDIYNEWLEALKVVTVDIEWLSNTVGQYQLVSLRPFVLCSDESLGSLNYPEELVTDSPFSFAHSAYTNQM